jgi:NADP-dependent 3-hydroxy acid dehydrogenase YdfG
MAIRHAGGYGNRACQCATAAIERIGAHRHHGARRARRRVARAHERGAVMEDEMRNLRGAVVVLTGASSGIGRVAAQMFAEKGAKVVLAARDGGALEDVVRLCERRGGEAIAVPTDVRDEGQVRALRDAAVARFGRIDVWVNDAAVYMMGSFERVPSEDVRALLETNVMGMVHGSKAAITQFRAQGGGTLISVGSVAGKVAYAQASAYCASKHAIHALNAALRQELVGSPIQACIVAPATVDTPLFDHAANYTGREMRAMPPIYRPERVARAIVRCAERPRREVLVGGAPFMMSLMQLLTPWLFERVMPQLVARTHLQRRAGRDTRGNFRQPLPPHADRGGWKDGTRNETARLPAAAQGAMT